MKLGYFRGEWSFKRTVSGQGKIEGTAHFLPLTHTALQYREKGILLHTSGQQFDTFRDYIYRFDEGQIAVYFSEKPERLLHKLLIKGNQAKGTHQCDQDSYEALYTFTSPQQFSLTYWVKGPRKDHVIHTLFNRQQVK